MLRTDMTAPSIFTRCSQHVHSMFTFQKILALPRAFSVLAPCSPQKMSRDIHGRNIRGIFTGECSRHIHRSFCSRHVHSIFTFQKSSRQHFAAYSPEEKLTAYSQHIHCIFTVRKASGIFTAYSLHIHSRKTCGTFAAGFYIPGKHMCMC